MGILPNRVRSSELCALPVAREKHPSDFASSRISRLVKSTPLFLTCKCRASSLCSPVGDTAYALGRAKSRPEVTSNRAQQEVAHCLPTFCSDPYYILSLSGKLQIYNLFSVFLLLDPHHSKYGMNLICCTSMLKARTRGQFARTCALSPLSCRLSSRACASAVFEKQPSPLHLSLAIC